MELEKIKDEARKQISKAIGDALIDVRGEQQFLKKDNQQFKNDCQRAVKKLQNSIDNALEAIPNRCATSSSKAVSRLSSKLGAVMTNNKKHHNEFRQDINVTKVRLSSIEMKLGFLNKVVRDKMYSEDFKGFIVLAIIAYVSLLVPIIILFVF